MCTEHTMQWSPYCSMISAILRTLSSVLTQLKHLLNIVNFVIDYNGCFAENAAMRTTSDLKKLATEFKLHYIVPKHMDYDQNHFYCSYSLRSLSFTLICSIMASFIQSSSSHLPHSALLWKLCRVWRNKEECLDKIWSQVVTGDAFKMHDKTSCKC